MVNDREIVYRRCLRSFRRIASKDYHCDCCHRNIRAGEEYEVEIQAVHIRFASGLFKKEIAVWRKHLICEPPEEDRDIAEEWQMKREYLPKAA